MKVGDPLSPPPPYPANSERRPRREKTKEGVAPAATAHPSGAPQSADEAAKLARDTRELIARSNRDAVRSHNLDLRKLLDLLA